MTAYKREPGPHAVEQYADTWHDAARGRDVPVRIYVPAGLAAPAPLVVFSHGLGGSRDTYGYLGRHWASHGYVVVHPTHFGSDATALRGAGGLPSRTMSDFLADVPHHCDRPRDISFVLDRLLAEPCWRNRLDADRIAVAGHSFGAYTAHAVVGVIVDLPDRRGVSFTDARVKAAIAMSPQSPGKLGLRPDSWSRIDRPAMVITGTHDIEYGVGTADRRRMSFDGTPGRDQYLLTIRDATHATFSDHQPPRLRVKPRDPAHHDYVLMATTAFLDTYLRRDPAAQAWLLSGALAHLSASACHLEHKHVTPVSNRQP